MADAYRKHSGLVTPGSGPKFNMIEHCVSLASQYNSAAEVADALAKSHRAMLMK